jgi:hypothetical protein
MALKKLFPQESGSMDIFLQKISYVPSLFLCNLVFKAFRSYSGQPEEIRIQSKTPLFTWPLHKKSNKLDGTYDAVIVRRELLFFYRIFFISGIPEFDQSR